MTAPLLGVFKEELEAFLDPIVFAEKILDFKLFPKQKEIVSSFYTSERPELVVVAGRRSGKTKLAAVISLYEAFKLILLGNPSSYYGFSPNQTIFILNTAVSKEQARDTVFSADTELLHNSQWFQSLVDRGLCKEHYNEIIFPEPHVVIRSEHANSASLVGRTAKLCVFDELARFKDTKGNASGWNVYYSMSRSVRSFGKDGLIVSISSPVTVDDPIMMLYEMSQYSDSMLGFKLPTWIMNPNITREDLEDDFMKDPDMAQRDFGAEPSLVIENYYKEPHRIEHCVNSQALNPVLPDGALAEWFRQTNSSQRYFLAGDPAVKNDAFGLCLLHFEDHRCIVDLLHQFKPHKRGTAREIDARDVASMVIELSNRFPGIISFTTDIWNYPETLQTISRAGVRVVQNHVEKKEHDRLKEAIYSGMISFYNHPVLIKELKELELIRGTKVDHRKGGSSDIADALANAFSASGIMNISGIPKIMSVSSAAFRKSFGARGVVKIIK